MWSVFYTEKAVSDIPKLQTANLNRKAKEVIDSIKEHPFQAPPPFEPLQGDLQGAYFRRINIKHRIVYELLEKKKAIKVLSMWTDYKY